MPPVGFEPTISADERPQTHALDRAATGTGDILKVSMNIQFWYMTPCRVVVFEESCCLRSLGPRSPGRLTKKDDGLFRPRRQRLPSSPKRRRIVDTASYPRRLDFPQKYTVAGFVHYLQYSEQNAFLNLYAPRILYIGQTCRYSPEYSFYIFSQQIYFIIFFFRLSLTIFVYSSTKCRVFPNVTLLGS